MSIYLGSSEPSKIYVGSSAIKEAYVGDVKVRPSGWKPGPNTVAYFPFKDDQLDKVGSSSISITGTKRTLGYNFSRSGEILVQTPPSSCRFIAGWIKYNSAQASDASQFGGTYIGFMKYNFNHLQSSYSKRFEIQSGYDAYSLSNQQSTTTGQRYHIAMGYNGSYAYGYINGQQVWNAYSGHYETGKIRFGYGINMDVSEYILESQVRTAQEVSQYYYQTKSNYGL